MGTPLTAFVTQLPLRFCYFRTNALALTPLRNAFKSATFAHCPRSSTRIRVSAVQVNAIPGDHDGEVEDEGLQKVIYSPSTSIVFSTFVPLVYFPPLLF